MFDSFLTRVTFYKFYVDKNTELNYNIFLGSSVNCFKLVNNLHPVSCLIELYYLLLFDTSFIIGYFPNEVVCGYKAYLKLYMNNTYIKP